MKIVITGASGMIGRELQKELAGKAQMLLLSRTPQDGYISTDYSVESLTGIFEGVDVVVHLAAKRGAAEDYQAFAENAVVTENVLKAMVLAKVRKIIFMSSISVYSNLQEVPWRETQRPIPQTFYAQSKITGEGLLSLYARKGVQYTIFRCAIVLGKDESGRMIAVFTRKAAAKETLQLRGKSIAKRDFIYVKDVVRAVVWDIFSNDEINQLYNLGSQRCYTNLEVAQLINSCYENDGNLEYDDSVAETVTDSYMSSDKLEDAGFKAQYSFADALLDMRNER